MTENQGAPQALTAFFKSGPTDEIAQRLLGAKLSVGPLSGYIVETEAYLGERDQAAHSYGGRHTKRSDPLYQEAGLVYVYQIRTQFLLNFIAQAKNVPQGILIRGVQPATGVTQMTANRHGKGGYDLTNGPGKLCQAFGIDLKDNNVFVDRGRVCLSLTEHKKPAAITAAPRIGVPNHDEWTLAPLRFYVTGNPYVSQMRKRDMNLTTEGWQSK
ncbi:3-methyladenine DNA glycosylase [Lactobacillus selangorensis]|uniref:Putative 3-methyladenine DNA glycosylase n=1 Tax=Lactobacillus selangorensis TaxID=81857 RepID=A0A0R2FLX7_9LACO|nr:DNA-3-methyladenine glycosylase [Lactobacillus selangorensis]KRN29544.1 3-methyladenine DNA glycosylase [Lactobacillus selangorensis]KRN33926.1 3-methyladenine DNA glycosylase [Lactobacillus selangorensis]